MSGSVLVTGATGFIGGRLAARLAGSGREVRCLVRDRGGTRARELEREGFDLHEGDVLRPETLRGAGHGVDVAYYLIHSMGRGGPRTSLPASAPPPRRSPGWRGRRGSSGSSISAASVTARSPSICAAGTRPRSRSARRPAADLLRAGMVVGPQSESYRTLRYLVQRLPAMIAPAWLKNATQPIAIDDTLSYLIEALTVEASAGREIQIGGPDVLSYGEMLDRMAEVLDIRRRPRIPVPLITPWLSSLWIGLVTPVDAGRGETVDRRTRCANGRHRPLRNDTVRHRANRLRPSDRPRRGGRPRTCAPMRALERLFISRPARIGIILLWLVLGGLGGLFAQPFQYAHKNERVSFLFAQTDQGKSLGDAVLGKIKDAWTRAVLRPTS